jgi:hypothetical protein
LKTTKRSLALLGALLLPRIAAAQSQTQVTVSGVVYAQYGYLLKDAASHANSFNLTRAYVNLIAKLAGGVSTRVTADIFTNSDSSRAYRIKYAYLAYTPNGSPLAFKLGVIHTPWLDWEEAVWDYRMQGSMATERGGYLTSADFGAGVDGKWGADRVNMQLTVVNGEGYSKGTGDQRKDAQGRVSVRLLDTSDSTRVGGLRLTAYGQYGKPTTGGARQRFIGMLSYKSKTVTLAGAYAITKDSVTAGALLDGHVASAFGVLHFPGAHAAMIARVDHTTPNTNVASTVPGFSNTRYIVGLSYQLTPNVRLLGDVDYVSYRNGAPSPAADASRAAALFQTQFTF